MAASGRSMKISEKPKKKLSILKSVSKTAKLPKIESVFNENFELEYESYDTIYEGLMKSVNKLIIHDKEDELSYASSHSSSGSKANMELLSRIPKLQDENQMTKKKKPSTRKVVSKATRSESLTNESEDEMVGYTEDIVFDVEDMVPTPKDEEPDDVDIDNLIQTRVGDKDVYYDPDKSIVYSMKFKIIGFINDEGEIEIDSSIDAIEAVDE